MKTVAEVAIIGAGMSGLATACRLQARGISTLVLEAHGQVGGCAGFFRQQGFSFDVGATTFVDFEPSGVGGQFITQIGLPPLAGERLPGYQAWLPDRQVTLYRNPILWQGERLAAFGHTPNHQRFWSLIDQLAEIFWAASRAGIKLPIQSVSDLWQAVRTIPLQGWPLARYLNWTMADALADCCLERDQPLMGLLSMLLQDTVHASPQSAPLINSALGITIRGAGLTRPHGGAQGFWRLLTNQYRALGGHLRVGTRVERLDRTRTGFTIQTRKGTFQAQQIVSAIPIWNSAQLGLPEVTGALQPYLQRDESALGGALVLFLGVPENEVAGQPFTHHQILVDYDRPLNNGNNMFISVSTSGEVECAPLGWRAVMISTHCDLEEWEGLTLKEYQCRKSYLSQQLLDYAHRVYPNLGERAQVLEMGTPRTYATYTHRHRGAVGGLRLNRHNSNQRAVPYDIGVPGFWLVGDTTWPGLGTVACVLGSRHVAEAVIQTRPKQVPFSQQSAYPKEIKP